MITADEAEVERFMSHVDQLPCGCWFWTGARSRGTGNRKWYGTFWSRTAGRVRAHRWADEVFNHRELPLGHHRDHTCVFSLCVNPAHIEHVTHAENQRRKMERRQKETER